MDGLKLFAKSQDQIDSMVNTAYTFSQDIRMKFGVKNCGVLMFKRGKADKAKSIGLKVDKNH